MKDPISEDQFNQILAEIDSVPGGIDREGLRQAINSIARSYKDFAFVKLLATKKGRDSLRDIRVTARKLACLLRGCPIPWWPGEGEEILETIDGLVGTLDLVTKQVAEIYGAAARRSAVENVALRAALTYQQYFRRPDWLLATPTGRRATSLPIGADCIRFTQAVLSAAGISVSDKFISNLYYRERGGKTRNKKSIK